MSWVPLGYLPVIVGVSINGRLISESTTLFHGTEIGWGVLFLSNEGRKRVTKFVNLAFADKENPTLFPASRVCRCSGFENLARRVALLFGMFPSISVRSTHREDAGRVSLAHTSYFDCIFCVGCD